MSLQSSPASDATRNSIARIRRNELYVGEVLGQGGFNDVFAVYHRSLPPKSFGEGCNNENRRCKNYAIKIVRKELRSSNKKLFRRAINDLVNEARILSILDHPHVLKLRGLPKPSWWGKKRLYRTSENNKKVQGDSFFIVTDRLRETLRDNIHRWQTTLRRTEARLREMLPLKIDYACQMACALQYLHSKRIVYRDLKPENVGFHQEDQDHVLLFDFGLSRELPSIKPKLNWIGSFDSGSNGKDDSTVASIGADSFQQEETYKMTICGTQRYMSREVLLGGNYNCKSDVYSLAMVIWELLTEIKPFHYMTPAIHKILVAEKGERPLLNSSFFGFTPRLCDVLKRSWQDDIANRLTMAELYNELSMVLDGNNDNAREEEEEEKRRDNDQVQEEDDEYDDQAAALSATSADSSLCSRTRVFVDTDCNSNMSMDMMHCNNHEIVLVDLDKPMIHEDMTSCTSDETGIEVTSKWTLFLPHDDGNSMIQLQ